MARGRQLARAAPSLFRRATFAVLLLVPGAAAAGPLSLPPGFASEVYITGEGFDTGRVIRGFPSTSTAAFDTAGTLYLARTGRRYTGGAEVEDRWPLYRVPPGGARVTPETEARVLHGPPLPNPQVAVLRDGRDLVVTTFDRERRIGVLYRVVDGRAELLAGGTPERGSPPLLRQPEGVAADAAGHIYVADREQGVVVRLSPSGQVLDARWLGVLRPRLLAWADGGWLWLASDAQATAPWQREPGEIWRVSPDGAVTVVLRGPLAAGMSPGPGGHLFVADRPGQEIFALGADGRRARFAGFGEGAAPRTIVFAPDTPATRRAGIAGDLFVVVVSQGSWAYNEVYRVTGPFAQFARQALGP